MKYLFTIAIVMLGIQPAQALCLGVGLKNVPATQTYAGTSGGYAVYALSDVLQTVNFQVEVLTAALSCNYYVVLSAGSSNSVAQRQMPRVSGGGVLDYNAYTTLAKTSILKDNATASASERINGSFGAVAVGVTNNHSFYWSIKPGTVVSAGSGYFQDTVTVSLYSEVLFANNYVLAQSKNITLRALADSSIDLSLVDSGGAFSAGDTAQTVDFDTLTSGEFLNYDTMIRSNDGYAVTFQSQNGQRLKHLTSNATVPYSVQLDGNTLDLSSGSTVQVKTQTGTTPAAGHRLPTRFTIGTLSGGEPPGDYKDVITVTISAY